MNQLFIEFIKENVYIWTDDFKKEISSVCREMVKLEDKFLDLVFEMGDIQGLTKTEMKEYIRYIADRRLLQLGLKPNYGIKDNEGELVFDRNVYVSDLRAGDKKLNYVYDRNEWDCEDIKDSDRFWNGALRLKVIV